MRKFMVSVMLGSVLLSVACSGHYVVKPLKSTTPNANVEGFRYYLPKPYLLVTNVVAPAAEGEAQPQVTVKVVYLPDMANPFVITTKNSGFGTFDGTLQLTDGWMLTNVNEKSDPKIAETLTAISGLVGTALSSAKGIAKSPPSAVAAPFVYLFEIDLEQKTLTRVNTDELNKLLCRGPCR